MPTLQERLLTAIRAEPGLSDRELADRLLEPGRAPQPVNAAARRLVARGRVERRRRHDGRIGNFPAGAVPGPADAGPPGAGSADLPDEDAVKAAVRAWLEARGWTVAVRWRHEPGVDIDARRGAARWIVEATGPASHSTMRGNYFRTLLGQLVLRMDDPHARYAIALPDHPDYRRLWGRLPRHARRRLGISALFVSRDGVVTEVA